MPPRERSMTRHIGRRVFITLIGGAAAAWPLAVGAQQLERMRRVAFLSIMTQNDPDVQLLRSACLARPGGNLTGITNFEFAIGGKWLQLLKQIAPLTSRV